VHKLASDKHPIRVRPNTCEQNWTLLLKQNSERWLGAQSELVAAT
jgi:hypothetical protein